MAQAQLDYILQALAIGTELTAAEVAVDFHVPVDAIMLIPPQATPVPEEDYDPVVFDPSVPALLTADNPVVYTAQYVFVCTHDGLIASYFKFNRNN